MRRHEQPATETVIELWVGDEKLHTEVLHNPDSTLVLEDFGGVVARDLDKVKICVWVREVPTH